MAETREIKIQTVMSEKHLTPLRAIRKHCVECGGGQPSEVRRCHIDHCPLHPYRMGHNPRRAGLGGRPPEDLKTRTESAKAEEAGAAQLNTRATEKAGLP